MRRSFIALFAALSVISLEALAATATWDPVTTARDGTPVTPGGYELGIGTTSGVYTTIIDAGSNTSVQFARPDGTAYVAVRAYPSPTDTRYSTSPWSAEVVLQPQAPAPSGSVTLGETSILGSPDGNNANYLLAQRADLDSPGTLTSLSFYVTSAAGTLRLGVYDASGPNGHPGAKLAETAEITPVSNSWNTADVLVPVDLQPGTYWLAFLPSDNGLGHVGTASGNGSVYRSYCYGEMPASFDAASACNASGITDIPNHWSFYGTLSNPLTAPINLHIAP